MHPYNDRTVRSRKQARSPVSWLPAALLAAVLAAGGFVPNARAQDEDEIPFDEAEIFFELNNSDGDLGIHALIDGDAWKRLWIKDPNERINLDVRVRSRLRRQGLTEFFFESAEPTFDELLPEEFFARFPEGVYEVSGLTIDGEEMESETEVTHVMPAPPVPSANGEPLAIQCDDEEPGFDAPEVSAPVTISWPEVLMSHPDLGRSGEPIEVVNYEAVVEIDDTPFKTSAILPPDQTSFDVPSEILALADPGDQIKFEVLVREASFNQTATESCFVLVE